MAIKIFPSPSSALLGFNYIVVGRKSIETLSFFSFGSVEGLILTLIISRLTVAIIP
jgi:hypothetical protein